MTRHVLIVGAGISGLTLAQMLRRAGVQVMLIEKVAAFRPVGAGLILSVNALQVLERLSMVEELQRVGQPLSGAVLTDVQGRAIQTLSYREHSRALAVHRADLQEQLGHGLQRDIRFGTTVLALRQDPQGVTVTLSDASEHRVDCVVGADGLHSATRQLAFGDVRLRYAGYTSWRFVARTPWAATTATEVWGRGRRLGLVPLSDHRVYGYVTANAPEGGADSSGTSVDALRALCRDFQDPAPEVLGSLPATTPIIRTDIHEVNLKGRTQGRVALIGDAAHAMTPNLGQGAAMGIEDAFVLGRALTSDQPVEAALQTYERLRRTRVEKVQLASHQLGVVGQLESGWLSAARNTLMRSAPPAFTRSTTRELLTPPGG